MKKPSSTVLSQPREGVSFLRLYQGQDFIRSYRLQGNVIKIGRDPEVQIHLEDGLVSRFHAQIEIEREHNLYVQDLGSKHGTWLNGKKVVRVPLGHGDELAIGPFRMVVSHPIAPQGTVIPFPNSRTQAETTIRAERPRFSGLLFLAIVSLSLSLAWGLNYWLTHTQIPRPVQVMAQKPISKPALVQPEIVRNIEPIPARKKRKTEKQKEDKNLLSTLDNTLGSVGKSELNEADRLHVLNPLQDRTQVAKRIQAKATSPLEVDIRLPRMEEVEKRLKEIQKAKKPFDLAQYQSHLREKIDGIEGCYAKHGKGEGGSIAVWFKLKLDGTVGDAGVESSDFTNAGLQSCILDRIRQIKVDPPPWDSFMLTYAFRFGVRKITF